MDFFDPSLDIPEATAEFTYKKEFQPDRSGQLSVYKTPLNDGGGKHEVAGVNVRYHPKKFEELKALVNRGQFAAAETEAKQYYLDYSEASVKWIPEMLFEFQKNNGYPMGEGVMHQLNTLEGLLRATAFNRGPGGAIIFLQKALNKTLGTDLSIDGGMGSNSRKAMIDLLSKNPPKDHENEGDYWLIQLLSNFKTVSMDSEKKTGRKNLINGMINRINDRDQYAREILHETNPVNQ